MVDWHDLLTAAALVLVFEGIMPFLNPGGLRRTLALINQLNDKQLRIMGMVSMGLGLFLLFLVRE